MAPPVANPCSRDAEKHPASAAPCKQRARSAAIATPSGAAPVDAADDDGAAGAAAPPHATIEQLSTHTPHSRISRIKAVSSVFWG